MRRRMVYIGWSCHSQLLCPVSGLPTVAAVASWRAPSRETLRRRTRKSGAVVGGVGTQASISSAAAKSPDVRPLARTTRSCVACAAPSRRTSRSAACTHRPVGRGRDQGERERERRPRPTRPPRPSTGAHPLSGGAGRAQTARRPSLAHTECCCGPVDLRSTTRSYLRPAS